MKTPGHKSNDPPSLEHDEWLTLEEARKHAKIKSKTLWVWRKKHRLKSSKIGGVVRIRKSELDKFLDAHRE